MHAQSGFQSHSAGQGGSSRGSSRMGRAVRQHLALLAFAFAVASSAVFVAAPSLKRAYTLEGVAHVIRGGEKAVDAQRILDEVLNRQHSTSAVQLTASLQPGGDQLGILLHATSPTPTAAVVRMHLVADQFQLAYMHANEEAQSATQAELQKRVTHLTDDVKKLSNDAGRFRIQNPGVLPDDPQSVVAQAEAINRKVDEKTQRQQIVADQITRLEAYQTRQKAGSSKEAPPPPIAPAAAAAAPAPSSPENDPEVVALTAQMQLLNTQVEEQINTMHRTDQHPYVIDLRNQQTELQKKLDAAKLRVAAGKPPPPTAQLPTGGASARAAAGGETSLASTQVELQLESLRSENGALQSELKTLVPQKDDLQKQVQTLLPLRDQYASMQSDLHAKQQALQDAKNALAATGVSADEESGERVAPRVLPMARPAVRIDGLNESPFPSSPNVVLIYGVGTIAGLIAAGLMAWILATRDRGIHDLAQAAQLEVPILGATQALLSPQQIRARAMWRTVGQPLAACVFLAVAGGTAFLCYRHLSDRAYVDKSQANGGDTFSSSTVLGEVRP